MTAIEQLGALVAVGKRLEVLMDTLALLGWPQQLPPTYKEDWARYHVELRRALGVPIEGEEARDGADDA